MGYGGGGVWVLAEGVDEEEEERWLVGKGTSGRKARVELERGERLEGGGRGGRRRETRLGVGGCGEEGWVMRTGAIEGCGM